MKWLFKIFKTYIQWDFLTAFFVGMKYFIFKKRATINYPHEKGRLSSRGLEVNMLLGDIQMEKKGVLPVNYVKQCAQHRP